MQDAVAGRLRVGRPLSRRSDAALVRSAQGGSRDAVEELFRRHWPAAHRAAWLVVHDAAAAEDIAQEAFVSALRALDRFDRRRPLGPWLHRIVVNRAIDWSRARALRPETGADTLPEPAAPGRRGRDRRRRRRRARRPRARAPRGRRPAPPARLHAGRDRGDARPPARHGQLPPAPRARRAEPRAGGGRDDPRRVAALERALREAEPPDAGAARERARRTVLAAHAQPARGGARARGAGSSGPPLAAVLAAFVVTQRDSGPAQAVERLVRDIVRRAEATPAPTPVSGSRCPRAGRLLVTGSDGLFVVAPQRPAHAARPLGRRDLVAGGPVRRRDRRPHARRARSGRRRRPLAPARRAARQRPALGARRHAHRLPRGQHAADRLRQRHPRRAARARTWRPSRPRGARASRTRSPGRRPTAP